MLWKENLFSLQADKFKPKVRKLERKHKGLTTETVNSWNLTGIVKQTTMNRVNCHTSSQTGVSNTKKIQEHTHFEALRKEKYKPKIRSLELKHKGLTTETVNSWNLTGIVKQTTMNRVNCHTSSQTGVSNTKKIQEHTHFEALRNENNQ